MSNWIDLLNGFSVSIFGIVLSWSFCVSFKSEKTVGSIGLSIVLLMLIQGILCFFVDYEFLSLIYPLTLHLPLFLILWFFIKKPLWSIFSVLTAYLCCQLRRYIVLVVLSFVKNGSYYQSLGELLVTFPLLFLLLRFVSKYIKDIAKTDRFLLIQFGLIPLIYYVFDYITYVYTDLLTRGNPIVVEFMPFVCSVAYLVFTGYHHYKEKSRLELLQNNYVLDMQLSQSVKEIDSLRQSQDLAKQYRHDLRHHLQYLLSRLDEGQTERARQYITEICQNMESQKVMQFCENELVNLILSSFYARAQKNGIEMRISGLVPKNIRISDPDICVLLSNALDNALHACILSGSSTTNSYIDVEFQRKNDGLLIQIINSNNQPVHFQNGIPITNIQGHGIGVKSICAIIKKYNGIYSFYAENDRFIFRASV